MAKEVYEVLHRHGAAPCIHEVIEDHPRELTTDWTNLRSHGDGYGGSYSHQYLSAEADRVVELLRDGIDVYAFFNNDAEGHPVADASDLRRYVDGRISKV